MNPQPFQTPPKWWTSRLSPRFVRWWRFVRHYELRQQRILEIQVAGGEIVRDLLTAGHGVLIVSNHSFHYDSYVLIEAGLRNGWTPHFMTAWQVFSLTGPWGRWLLQRHGCFSINREANDIQAFRFAVNIVQNNPHPLVIFPEGEIFHSNDQLTPFREGCAAVALSAAKKSQRPISIVPCAMKIYYTQDPQQELLEMMDRLENYIRWRPRPDLTLLERIYRFGNGFLAVKEVEYLGHPQTGELRNRIQSLADAVLQRIRDEFGLPLRGKDLHDQIKHVRGFLIQQIESLDKPKKLKEKLRPAKLTADQLAKLQNLREKLHDVFFVTQLTSYHGDYTIANPTIERIAETIDKFEEDIFSLQCPTPRGAKRAEVHFGAPLSVDPQQIKSAELATLAETSVQQLLDGMSAQRRYNPPN